MKFQVHGTRTKVVSVEVDADSADEALDIASELDHRDVDVWDSETYWNFAIEAD